MRRCGIPKFVNLFPSSDGSLDGVRIYGGQDAKEGQFPYQVALFRMLTRSFFCSGAIISKDWILTAGHCIDWYYSALPYTVGYSQPENSTEPRRAQFLIAAQGTPRSRFP